MGRAITPVIMPMIKQSLEWSRRGVSGVSELQPSTPYWMHSSNTKIIYPIQGMLYINDSLKRNIVLIRIQTTFTWHNNSLNKNQIDISLLLPLGE